MEKKEDKYKTSSLDSAIMLAQIEKFCDKFDRSMKKNLKKDFKRFLMVMIPFAISLGIMVAFPSLWTLFICLGVTISAVGISQYHQIRDELDLKPKKSQNILQIPEESTDEILAKGISHEPAESYYTDRYREFLVSSDSKPRELDAYERALERQRDKMTSKKPRGERNYLDKEETMMKIVFDLEIYKNAYNIPPINISSRDWDFFFDKLYEFFESRGIECEFTSAAEFIAQMSLARALTDASREITIFDFLKNLYTLERKFERDDGLKVRVSKKEYLQLQSSITANLEKKKIIEFNPKK